MDFRVAWPRRGGENFAREGLKWCYLGCFLGLGCTLYELPLCFGAMVKTALSYEFRLWLE